MAIDYFDSVAIQEAIIADDSGQYTRGLIEDIRASKQRMIAEIKTKGSTDKAAVVEDAIEAAATVLRTVWEDIHEDRFLFDSTKG